MIIWLTDTHLDFLREIRGVFSFAEYLKNENPEAQGLIITGDISNGNRLKDHLQQLAEGWTRPIYFVLGNHDYYKSSWKSIDYMVRDLVKETPNLYHLNNHYYEYDNHIICGVGGWYDAYNGNSNSSILLYDFELIEEISKNSRHRQLLLDTVRKRASYEANQLRSVLKKACSKKSEVIIVCTHVAPYVESSWHNGRNSNREWAPWFTSKSTGDVLDEYAEKFPDKKFIVLCGHSHSSGTYNRRENMIVFTGKAVYGHPDVSGIINTENRSINCFDYTSINVNIEY